MHIAASKGRVSVVMALVEAGANPDAADDVCHVMQSAVLVPWAERDDEDKLATRGRVMCRVAVV